MAFNMKNDHLKVLIVDDDQQLAGFLKELLTGEDGSIEVEAVHDGFEAGRRIHAYQPNVILLDLMMPGMSGVSVCHSLKADPTTASARIIAMTGYYTEENVQAILDAGAEACFAKPLDVNQLLKTIGL